MRRKYSRKKSSGEVSHGSWKIAYADFVTAMMAFFLLLWIISETPEDSLKGIAAYFSPSNNNTEGLGVLGGTNPNIKKGHYAAFIPSTAMVIGAPVKGEINQAVSEKHLEEKKYFIHIMNHADLKKYKQNIEVQFTDLGLIIKVMDYYGSPMFIPGSYEMTNIMKEILTMIASMIKIFPNPISIIGHTAKAKTSSDIASDLWALSALRANEARKFLIANSVNNDQMIKIIGVADTEPSNIKDPFNPQNIRIDIILLNNKSVNKQHKAFPEDIFTTK